MKRNRSVLFAVVSACLVASCGGGSDSPDPQPTPTPTPTETPAATFVVSGSVTGLTGTGLVLQNEGADDLNVAPNATAFQFPTALQSGAAYSVTVKTQPSSPAQVCEVTNGTGAVGTADVTNVQVVCTTVTRSVTTSVQGLATGATVVLNASFGGTAADVPVSANGPVESLTQSLVPGTAFAVTVKTNPTTPVQVCTASNGSGEVGATDIAIVVTCSTNSYTVGGTISGLTADGLVLHSTGGSQTLPVASGATTFTFPNAIASGAGYTVSVETQPAGLTCVVANGTGTVTTGPVTNVAVSCGATLVQRWAAPSTWGARWSAEPTMVQHAYFDGTGIVEDPAVGTGITWTVQGGAAPAIRAFNGFPAGARSGAGPFTGQRFQAAGDEELAAMRQDLIVCALVKPDYNPGAGPEKPIIAKGYTNDTLDAPGGGWALTQRRRSFTFTYTYTARTDGRTVTMWASLPTRFADEVQGTDGQPATVAAKPNSGPLNPSVMVVCGGRAGTKIYVTANSIADIREANVSPVGVPFTQLELGDYPLTIGGYTTDATKRFGGRVYETAIWNEAATPENLQKKMAAIQGVTDGAVYFRNREAPYYGADREAGNDAAGYHTAWNHGPRVDTEKGFLFGLQSWNRLSRYSFVNTTENPLFVQVVGENPAMRKILGVVRPATVGGTPLDTGGWEATGGATLAAADIAPPGDSEQLTVPRVTLPPDAVLKSEIKALAPGQVHGQIWVRVPAATTQKVQVRTDDATLNAFEIDLATVPVNTWKRFWLYRSPGGPGNELVTAGGPRTITIWAPRTNTQPVELYFWGLTFTQIGTDPAVGGAPLGAADPGAEMYDWNAEKTINGAGDPGKMSDAGDGNVIIDALQLPAVPASTATAGFCLKAVASMPASVPWNAPFTAPRTIVAWNASTGATAAKLYLSGATVSPAAEPRLCLSVTGSAPLCAAVPAAFTAGSTQTVTGCISSAGSMRLYVGASTAPVATGTATVATPDLQGGTLLVGGASVAGNSEPLNGYVSRAVICRDGGNLAACQ